ncbi:MAG: hypothetical protein AAGU75_24865, partial [Bacillota bacterium]
VSRTHDIPVLTFFLDEQTGKAGMSTRLEAFVDLISRKKGQTEGYGFQKSARYNSSVSSDNQTKKFA